MSSFLVVLVHSCSFFLLWRRIAVMEKNVQVAHERQITERFTRAIEQLRQRHEYGKKILEIRLGGIYALERIAKDSKKDHWTIMEILTAYVRENSPTALDETNKREGRRN